MLVSKDRRVPAIIKASGFVSGMLTFLAFACLLFSSTSAYLLSGEVATPDGKRQTVGIGPFVAGSSTRTSEVVWWSELNDANCCNRSLDIYKAWAGPHGLCSGKGHFSVPAYVVALQTLSSIASAFSFVACTVAFSSQTQVAIRTITASSLIAMALSCIHFLLWVAYPLAGKLQSEAGDVVPLWHPTQTSSIVPSPPVRMSFGFAFALCVASFVLLLGSSALMYSVARLPPRFYQADDDEDGLYGVGKL